MFQLSHIHNFYVFIDFLIFSIRSFIFLITSIAQKMKFSMKDFVSKCDQIRKKLIFYVVFISFIFASTHPVTFSTSRNRLD